MPRQRSAGRAGMMLDRPWKAILLPAMVLQWFVHVAPVRATPTTRAMRRARDPLATIAIAIAFWTGVLMLGWHAVTSSMAA